MRGEVLDLIRKSALEATNSHPLTRGSDEHDTTRPALDCRGDPLCAASIFAGDVCATGAGAFGAAFFYQPEAGVLADVIPFYWKGEYHVLYLQLKPGQKGFDWAQIVTRDFVSYRYTGVGVAHADANDAADLNIATGSVIEKDGVLYAFYCGQNPAFTGKRSPIR